MIRHLLPRFSRGSPASAALTVTVTTAAAAAAGYAFTAPAAPLEEEGQHKRRQHMKHITSSLDNMFARNVAACEEAAASSTSFSSTSSSSSPFVYSELTRGIKERAERERRLQAYVNTVAPMIADARRELERASRAGDQAALSRAQHRFQTLASRVQAESAALTWGSTDGEAARARFVERFGCTGWTDAALDEIAKHSPIVEMGAGRGQWQRALTRERGADVLAFDNCSALPGGSHPTDDTRMIGDVRRGDERKLSSWWVRRGNRTLLVVYPEGDLLERSLRRYDGDVLLFVGEGRGGVNGGSSLFDELEREWTVENTVEVRPFTGGYERLWVLRRRQRQRG